MTRPKVSSDASASALLGALAGFLASQGQIFQADTAFEGLRALAFLLAYAALFTLPPFLIWAYKAVDVGAKGARLVAIIFSVVYIASLCMIVLAMTGTTSTNGNTISFEMKDVYFIPTIALPVIWLLLVMVDTGEDSL